MAKKEMFRKAALEKIETIDQLEKMLKVTSASSWIALLGITLVMISTVIWSVIGTLPSTVTASGIIVSSTAATNTYLAPVSGTMEILVNEGDFIDIGDDIVRISRGGEDQTYPSDQRGYISTILKDTGTGVSQGEELIRLRPYVSGKQKHVAVCYVPVKDADKIKRGMEGNISLTSAESSRYGHMMGRVINVDSWATSTKGIESVVGTENNMAASLTKDGSVCAVTLEIYPASKSAHSKSGYFWSNAKGNEKIEITDRMMCSVKIITKTEKPIVKLFAKLKEVWGE